MAPRPRFKTASFSSPSDSARLDPSLLWYQRHEPSELSQLAMHKAKITEIDACLQLELQAGESSRPKLVIISGPAGASKSTAVRLLAKKHGRKLVEWVSPSESVGETSVMDAFGDFLTGAATHNPTSIALVEDLPNLFHNKTLQVWHGSLQYWIKQDNSPLLVVVFTDIDTSSAYEETLTLRRAFGPILESELVKSVKVNPVNTTQIKKALTAIVNAEDAMAGSALQVKNAIADASTFGDLRFAITALEVWFKGYDRATATKDSLTRPVPRDTQAGLFHTVGAVVYGSSRTDNLEDVLEEAYTGSDMFNLTLLDNYMAAHHQRLALSAAQECAEWLSVADQADSVEPLAALGIRDAIARSRPDPSMSRSFQPLKFTQYLKYQREKNDYRDYMRRSSLDLRKSGGLADTGSTMMQFQFGFKNTLDLEDDFDDFDDTDSDMEF